MCSEIGENLEIETLHNRIIEHIFFVKRTLNDLKTSISILWFVVMRNVGGDAFAVLC